MLLFHMAVLMPLLCEWHRLPSCDHSLGRDKTRCHLPPSPSTSHCARSFERVRSRWIPRVSFHYLCWWAPVFKLQERLPEQCRQHIAQITPFPSRLSGDVFVFIYPISPLATAWPCIRLTLAPGACNICVCVKYSAPLLFLRHNFRGVRALLGGVRQILTGAANCFVREIGRLASTHPATVLCLLPSVKTRIVAH